MTPSERISETVKHFKLKKTNTHNNFLSRKNVWKCRLLYVAYFVPAASLPDIIPAITDAVNTFDRRLPCDWAPTPFDWS